MVAVPGYCKMHCCGAIQLIKGHFGGGSVLVDDTSATVTGFVVMATTAVSFLLNSLVGQFVHKPFSGPLQ